MFVLTGCSVVGCDVCHGGQNNEAWSVYGSTNGQQHYYPPKCKQCKDGFNPIDEYVNNVKYVTCQGRLIPIKEMHISYC